MTTNEINQRKTLQELKSFLKKNDIIQHGVIIDVEMVATSFVANLLSYHLITRGGDA